MNKYSTSGEWELDTVVFSKEGRTTFIERQTRFYVAVKLVNRSASEMYRETHELYKQFLKHTFKTYTVDLRKEFAYYS